MAAIPRRRLGQTDMEVTSLGFGGAELHGGPLGSAVSDDQAERLLNAALDAGINFIDTAICYGQSEQRIGRYVSHRRDEYFLASKCGCVVDSPNEHVQTAENIRAGVENSLRLMKTDYLDLVQFHRPIPAIEFEADGALAEVFALKDEGKVRYIGVSSIVPNMYEHVNMGVFDAFQVPYSAMQRENEDAIAEASAAGAGVIIRGGVAHGAPVDWDNRSYYMLSNESMRDQWDRAKLDDLVDGSGRAAFLLRFTLANPGLDTTIVGTSNLDHLADNVATAELGPLPDDVVAQVKRRLDVLALD